MLYFSDDGLSVSDSANPVHHDGHVQGGYSVPLIITASDITSHQSLSNQRPSFHRIFQWLTCIRTENIPPFNPLTDEDNERIMVFNGEEVCTGRQSETAAAYSSGPQVIIYGKL